MELTNIRKILQTMEGKDMVDQFNNKVTVGDTLAAILGATKAKDGRDQIFAYKLGCKLVDKNLQNLKLDEYEYSLLKDAIDGPLNYGNNVLGQIRIYLEEIEKEKDQK